MGNAITDKIHEQGGGKSASAKELCSEIRKFRRSNALEYVKGQPERLAKLEKDINKNDKMKDVEKFRMLIEVEKIRQTEISNALPSEQSIKVDDSRGVDSSRVLMADKLSKEET